jgi:hypothetical protein
LNRSSSERQLPRTRSHSGLHGPINSCGVVASVTHMGTYAKHKKNCGADVMIFKIASPKNPGFDLKHCLSMQKLDH